MEEATVNVETGAKSGGLKGWFGPITVFGSILVGILIYTLILGDSQNFDEEGHPVKEGLRHWLGLMYKGGFLVPVALGLLFTVIVTSIERMITLGRAAGKGSLDVFVKKIHDLLQARDVEGAMRECDEQRGSVGNVVKEVLVKYREMERDTTLPKDQKVLAIQKAQEEAVALELPMLEKNFVIISTIVPLATLVGLIGTVLGMIRAFSALATSGTPDTASLSTGISEALINTALGITTSAIATVMYNYFTSRIDGMTFRMDEAGMTIAATFAEKHA
jgi:biopolymer transport protein ExbB